MSTKRTTIVGSKVDIAPSARVTQAFDLARGFRLCSPYVVDRSRP
ncbi:Uncharacterised protein [Mycobacteroides abscessus subsp. abscessus]|nr:Uncharacterised protein [Mycobacteroides abscessus subsp. abscessus]